MQFLKGISLLAIVMLAFTIGALAQTTIISPTGDGGFETGATFLANGWTVVNNATNTWQVGTATNNGGTRGAYVSNNGGTSNAYTTNTVQVSHFYRDVTFPAGETNIQLSFSWKGQGENASGQDQWDFMRVFLTDTSFTPVAGTLPSFANSIGQVKYNLQGTYVTATITIPAASAGTTKRLIFTWRNDGSGGAQPPAAVDNISLVSAAPGNIFSTPAGGNWSATTTWVGGVVPTAADSVTITDAATVTIDTAAAASTLNIGTGLVAPTTLEFQAGTQRSLTVGTNITVASNGNFQTSATGTIATHTLVLGGNLTNNGILDFHTNGTSAAALITFTGAANATFGGTGATTDVRTITVNKGASSASILELNPTNFTVQGVNTNAAGFLSLSNGTFRISGTFTMTNRVFTSPTYVIPSTGGIWLNNANFTVVGQAGGTTTANNGYFRVSNGIYGIGVTGADGMGGDTTGAVFIVDGGTINATRIDPQGAVTWTQTGGMVNVGTVANTRSNYGTFELFSTSSVFNISGGTINLIQASVAATPIDYNVRSTTGNISGGTLNVGTAATSTNFNFRIAGVAPSVFLNNAAPTTATLLGTFDTFGNTTVSPGSTLNLNGFVYFQDGVNFFNNGTVTGTLAGSNLYFFGAGGVNQLYGGGGVVTAPLANFSVENAQGLTIQAGTANQIIASAVFLYSGAITNSNKITIGNGGATSASVQIGFTGSTVPGGSFDQAPTFNIGTGGYTVSYQQESVARTTGFEIPSTRIINALTVANTSNLTIAGGDLTVTRTSTALLGGLTLTSGIVFTGANTLIHVSPGAATRTSGFVVGNLSRSYAAAGTYTYFVGDNTGTAEYSPVAVTVSAGTFPSSLTVSVVDAVLPGLSPTAAASRYWNLTEDGDLTATMTFTYVEADTPDPAVNTDEADFRVYRNNGGALENKCPTGPCVSITGNTATPETAQTEFSPWGIGGLLAPTAASVDVGGRVREANGRGISRARVTMTDLDGNVRMAYTNQFGYFRFAGVPAGSTYIFTATHRRYQFNQGPQVRTINAATDNINFTSSGVSDNFRPEATFYERAPFDFDGDGVTDTAVFRGSENVWYIKRSASNTLFAQAFGAAGDRLAPADFDGDGKTDLAVFRSSEANWYIWESASNSMRVEQFGADGDRLVPADFDGDGKADLSVWNDMSGVWRVKLSTDGSIVSQKFSSKRGVVNPIAADRNGDGKADFVLFDTLNGTWTTRTANGETVKEQFGQANDRAAVGDFDGDGLGDLAVYNTGENTWRIRFADGKELNDIRMADGAKVPVLGDFDGDGKYDVANFGNGVWSIRQSVSETIRQHQFGLESDTVIPAVNQ